MTFVQPFLGDKGCFSTHAYVTELSFAVRLKFIALSPSEEAWKLPLSREAPSNSTESESVCTSHVAKEIHPQFTDFFCGGSQAPTSFVFFSNVFERMSSGDAGPSCRNFYQYIPPLPCSNYCNSIPHKRYPLSCTSISKGRTWSNGQTAEARNNNTPIRVLGTQSGGWSPSPMPCFLTTLFESYSYTQYLLLR